MRLEPSSIKDLPDTHRMGHTCANLNGELFFIWGGSNESTASLAARNNHLWIYDTLTGYWRHRSCSGECPPNLSGATSSLIGQKMYIFGGHSSIRENWLNGVFCLNLETFNWRDLGPLTRGQPTKPIKCDKCVSWSYNGNLYVFGGYGWSQTEHLSQLMDRQKDLQLTADQRWPRFGWNNQLVEFDPRDNTWRWPSYTGQCPSARAAHSGAIMGDTYFLFGGRDSRQRLNDLYTLNMKTFQWTQVLSFSAGPQLDRPIGHLLESEEDSSNEQLYDDLEEDEMQMPEHQLEGQEEEEEDGQEHLTPSPSSSMQYEARNWGLMSAQHGQHIDNDDDDDEDMDYPLPAQMLERWSVSSAASQQSAAGSPTSSSNRRLDDCQTVNNTQADDNDQSAPSRTQNHAATHNQQQQQQQAGDGVRDSDSVVSKPEDGQPDKEVPLPIGRSFGSFTKVSHCDIMLYGGINSQDEVLHDCWLFNTKHNTWTQIDLKPKQQAYPRLWHTGSCTKNNELVIIGGSNTSKIDHFCSDVLTISLEPKSLKRTALDAVARSIRMRTINKVQGLPSTVGKVIKLRKQAMALTTIRRNNSRQPLAAP